MHVNNIYEVLIAELSRARMGPSAWEITKHVTIVESAIVDSLIIDPEASIWDDLTPEQLILLQEILCQ